MQYMFLVYASEKSFQAIPPAQRAVLGIGDGLIRLSVGIEDIEDLRADIRGSLDAI